MKRRQRAYAYITNRNRLLVFRHTDFPDAGIQVPAGTVRPGETPVAAVMREAEEETGLATLEFVRCLGNIERNMTEFGKKEIQEAWFFHLRCPGTPAETWRYHETSGGTVAPIRFDFFWAELPHNIPELIALDGTMLAELNASLNQKPKEALGGAGASRASEPQHSPRRSMMSSNIEIVEETADILSEYGRIPISFEVHSIFRVELVEDGLKGIRLSEHPVAHSWIKDYDAINGEGPIRWADRWDISNWGVISAIASGTRVGGCVIAHDTQGVHKLEGRNDIAALWDIRVAHQWRGNGIGGLLIKSAIAWAKRRNCRILKVETQNINVPACRFYAKHGFTLAAINRFAYSELPDEVELIWCKDLCEKANTTPQATRASHAPEPHAGEKHV